MIRPFLLLPFFLMIACMADADTLRRLADKQVKLVGTAIKRDYIADPDSMSPEYHETLAAEFNLYVAENCFKMATLLKTRPQDPFAIRVGDLNTKPIESLVALATANGVNHIRGHTLIWHDSMPPWLPEEAPGWNSEQIIAFATSYITAVLTYCREHAPMVHEWDVINEILTPDGFRDGTWYDGVDDKQAFIDACFLSARDADPNVRLIYNDYGIELYGNNHRKNAVMLDMAQGMISRGVPLDGIGIQAHFTGPGADGTGGFSEESAAAFQMTFTRLAQIDLDCIVTELDLRLPTDREDREGGVTDVQLAEQGVQYQRIVSTALAQPNCPAILTWGFTDAASWIPHFFKGSGHALPFDHHYQKKPAYHGMQVAFENALERACSTN